MPHIGGWLPSAFAFTPVVASDLRRGTSSWSGELAASEVREFTLSGSYGFNIQSEAASTQVELLDPYGNLDATLKLRWALRNNDAVNPHDGGYNMRYLY